MSISNEQFLFSCIDNSNGGTVNWQKVADECGIVSKGAAAIKYRRLKEKFGAVAKEGAGATPSAEDGTPTPADNGEEPKKTKKTPTKKTTPKKRKMNNDEEEDENSKVKAEMDEGST